MFNPKEQQKSISELAVLLKHTLNLSDHPVVPYMLGFPEAATTHGALCCWLVEYQFKSTVGEGDIAVIQNNLES